MQSTGSGVALAEGWRPLPGAALVRLSTPRGRAREVLEADGRSAAGGVDPGGNGLASEGDEYDVMMW